MPQAAPYGSWTSPVTPALLVEQAVGLGYLSVTAGRAWWIESRPAEAGRQVLVSVPLDGSEPPRDETPPDMSARTQVHEYGGQCYAVHDSSGHDSSGPDRSGWDPLVLFANWADQRLYVVQGPSGRCRAVTPEAPGRSIRFADPVIDPSGRWAVCVRESHPDGGGEAVNDLVAVALWPDHPMEPVRLAAGHDFYSAPRLAPDGAQLAWLTWDHPDMPWDATQLWVADVARAETPRLGDPQLVAGGPGESVTQPRWSPSGVLHYVSDRSGWWNIYDAAGRAVVSKDAEFADPDWVFGQASYGFDPAGTLVAAWSEAGIGRLGRLDAGELRPVDLPYRAWSYVHPIEGGVVAVAASPVDPPAVVRIGWDGREPQILKASRTVTVPAGTLARPEPIDFPTGRAATAHALFYRPANEDFVGPADQRPPVIVMIHGGPTSQAQAVLNMAVQFWTSRGFAVADVDYRGSSGYGRAYRQQLAGAWGIADVEDCAAVVAELDRRGLVDGGRALIRGGSAGGFTTLAALAFTDAFAAGASHYGVADLELLAKDTHKFESRYLDSLVGPYPEQIEEYHRRSPIHHVGQIDRPLILFQGLEDKVVPPEQSDLMFQALRDRGVPVAYVAFEGEQHGFRQASTVMAVMSSELRFYGRVFGFTPDVSDDVALDIANGEKLSPPG